MSSVCEDIGYWLAEIPAKLERFETKVVVLEDYVEITIQTLSTADERRAE